MAPGLERAEGVREVAKEIDPLGPIRHAVWVGSMFMIAQCALGGCGDQHSKAYASAREVPREHSPEAVAGCGATKQNRYLIGGTAGGRGFEETEGTRGR